jgi:hypothetical protein
MIRGIEKKPVMRQQPREAEAQFASEALRANFILETWMGGTALCYGAEMPTGGHTGRQAKPLSTMDYEPFREHLRLISLAASNFLRTARGGESSQRISVEVAI